MLSSWPPSLPRAQHAQRFTVRSEIDSRYSSLDDASGTNDGRLAVAMAAKARYEERADFLDKMRQMGDKSKEAMFGRLTLCTEHKSEGAAQQRVYW